jgi:hypothetical protein
MSKIFISQATSTIGPLPLICYITYYLLHLPLHLVEFGEVFPLLLLDHEERVLRLLSLNCIRYYLLHLPLHLVEFGEVFPLLLLYHE